MKVLVLLPFLISFLYGRPTLDGENESTGEHVTVEKVFGTIRRTKRSTDSELADFPDSMVFQFEMTSGHVVFNLQRSVHPHKLTPIYRLDGDGINLHSAARQRNFAVYQDERLGASVLVKTPQDSLDEYHLMGAFTHAGEYYQIDPVYYAREKRDLNNTETLDTRAVTHRVRRQDMPYGDFNGDELIPPAQGSGLNRDGVEFPPFPSFYGNVSGYDNVIPLQMSPPDAGLVNPTSETFGPGSQQSSSRRRRQTDIIHIEYLVVADNKNLERWKSVVGGSTEEDKINAAFEAMHEYYQFVVNGIDIRIRTATVDGPEMRVYFSSLLVSTAEATSPWVQNNKLSENSVDDAGVLLDFAMWKGSVKLHLPTHDHAGLFTGYDLATPTSLNPIGMGYLNSVCHDSWAVSTTEENYNAVTIHIAAHELGHNIGTRHDGSGNSCPSTSLYLMAPRLPFIYDSDYKRNPWTFSTCSQASIKTYVTGLGSDSCLNNVPEQANLSDDIAGVRYSADEQCNMTYGDDAVLCRENIYYQWDSICYAMQCRRKGQTSCEGRFFPFEGTPCGDKKWCEAGVCVASDEAPSSHNTCVFNDDPHTSCSKETSCSESDLTRLVHCCGTCLGLNDPTTTPTTSTSSTSLSTTSSTSTTTSPTTTPSTTSSTTTSSTTSPTTTPSTTSSTTTSSTTSSTTTPSTTSSTTTPSTTSSTTTPSTTSSTTTPSTTTSTTTPSTTSSATTPSTTTSSTTPPSTTSSTTSSTTTSPTTSSSTTSPTTSATTTSPTTSSSTSTTTTTTNKPKVDMTFDLQTMISLFVSAAIVI